jgi:hypothetical protein
VLGRALEQIGPVELDAAARARRLEAHDALEKRFGGEDLTQPENQRRDLWVYSQTLTGARFSILGC